MIKIKTVITIVVVLVYLTIVGLFVNSTLKSLNCSYFKPCIRFCSSNREEYSDQNLLNEFIKSDIGEIFTDNENKSKPIDVNVYRGTPCQDLKQISIHEVVEDDTYFFRYSGKFVVDHVNYHVDRYCLDKPSNDEAGWKVMVCSRDTDIHKYIHLTSTSAALIILGCALSVYIYFSELRDFHGNCIIGLVASQMIAYLSLSISLLVKGHHDTYMRMMFTILITGTCTITALLWLTAMIIYTNATFKNFKDDSSNSHKFSTYLIFIFNAIVFSIITYLVGGDRLSELTIGEGITFMCLYLFDIILLISTGIKIFKLSKKVSQADQSRFDSNRKLYWITVKLCAVMFLTWKFEIYLWIPNEFHFYDLVVGDITRVFTSFVISAILIGRSKVKHLLVHKYRGFSDAEVEN